MIIEGVKELTVKLSNGEEVIIIGGVGDMEDICVTWSGEFDEYIGDLLEDYRMEQNVYRKRDIADKFVTKHITSPISMVPFRMETSKLQSGRMSSVKKFINV